MSGWKRPVVISVVWVVGMMAIYGTLYLVVYGHLPPWN